MMNLTFCDSKINYIYKEMQQDSYEIFNHITLVSIFTIFFIL